jgi:hypothetical protein
MGDSEDYGQGTPTFGEGGAPIEAMGGGAPEETGGGGGGGQFQMPQPGTPAPMDAPLIGLPEHSGFFYADPTQGLNPQQQTLLGEYAALHGSEAQMKVKELDNAAKFRRAMGMLTEMFATLNGRPDIGALARSNMVREDMQRSREVQGQILAQIGQRSIDREREAYALKQEVIQQKGNIANKKSEDDDNKERRRVFTQARLVSSAYRDKDGKAVDPADLGDAMFDLNKGNPEKWTALMSKYTYDDLLAQKLLSGARAAGWGPMAMQVAESGAKAYANAPVTPMAGAQPLSGSSIPPTPTEKRARDTKVGEAEGRIDAPKVPFTAKEVDANIRLVLGIPKLQDTGEYLTTLSADHAQASKAFSKIGKWASSKKSRLGDEARTILDSMKLALGLQQ